MDKKVYVSSNFMITFICPECGASKSKDVSRFIKHETQVKLKYKCTCQHSFSLILERRRAIRKKVRLIGNIHYNSEKYPMTIEDLSKHGVKIKLLKNISLKEEEKIEIDFILDDPKNSKVSRQVRIKTIIPPVEIGCEFISHDHQDNLGKYFLFYYQ